MFNQTKPSCPECGKDMGLVAWTGSKPPVCNACAGASTVKHHKFDTGVEIDTDDMQELEDSMLGRLDASKKDIQRLEEKLDRIIMMLEGDTE